MHGSWLRMWRRKKVDFVQKCLGAHTTRCRVLRYCNNLRCKVSVTKLVPIHPISTYCSRVWDIQISRVWVLLIDGSDILLISSTCRHTTTNHTMDKSILNILLLSAIFGAISASTRPVFVYNNETKQLYTSSVLTWESYTKETRLANAISGGQYMQSDDVRW